MLRVPGYVRKKSHSLELTVGRAVPMSAIVMNVGARPLIQTRFHGQPEGDHL